MALELSNQITGVEDRRYYHMMVDIFVFFIYILLSQSHNSFSLFLAQRLYAELSLLNLNLPAKVFLPFYGLKPHYIIKIPHSAAVVLNSKDKVNFLTLIVECIYRPGVGVTVDI